MTPFLPSTTVADVDSHYNEVIPGKLFVGDKHVAEDTLLLEAMGVTHIVSCGFEQPLQSPRKFVSLCINVLDVPEANLLQYLPLAVKFIETAIQYSNGGQGAVYVHCVHGQSRSCSVCVAFLMRRQYSPVSLSTDLLSTCYYQVQQCRPSMAINPGFVRQLDLFGRMGCGLLVSPTEKLSSRAYASFRSFRAKSQYQEHSAVSHKFQSVPSESQAITDAKDKFFSCTKCRKTVFCSFHVLDEWTETSLLPSSLYWADSLGGKEYQNQRAAIHKVSPKVDPDFFFEIEPMDWILSQMLDSKTGLLMERGTLNCPGCYGKIGIWDWKFPKLVSAIFIQKAKVTALKQNILL